MNKRIVCGLIATAAMTVALGGCGGGGGGSDPATQTPVSQAPPAASPKAEGAYLGTTSEGYGVSLLVLEDDAAWAMYQWNGYLIGFVQGVGVSNSGSYTIADGRQYNLLDGSTGRGSISASYVAGTSIQGTITPATGAASTFTAATPDIAVYDYHQAATPAAIAGSWPGFYGAGYEYGTVNVSTTGEVSAITSQDCHISGSAVPRPSGKNVYDVRIVFGPAPCALPGQAATGIAIISTLPTGKKQLIVGATDSSREFASTFVGTR